MRNLWTEYEEAIVLFAAEWVSLNFLSSSCLDTFIFPSMHTFKL